MTGDQAAFEERWRRAIEAYHESALLAAAVTLGLPDTLANGPATASELAAGLGLSPPHLLRFLRGLCTIGVCEEGADGAFALTRAGQALRHDSPSRLGKKVEIVVGQYWLPWADLVATLETGKPAFDDVFGMAVRDWRQAHPEQGKLFETYLAGEIFDQAGAIIEVLDGAAEAKRVAEISGGCGALLAALLIAHPHLTGVLFERPHVIDMAGPSFDQAQLTDRVELMLGDVLAEIPVAADLYLLNCVLAQWDDTAAGKILANIRRAMPDGAKLAIIERLLPDRAGDDPAAIMLDLHMMAITGGRARSLHEFEELLSAAGFSLAHTTATRSGLTLMEGTPR
jgi:hypothetical protein